MTTITKRKLNDNIFLEYIKTLDNMLYNTFRCNCNFIEDIENNIDLFKNTLVYNEYLDLTEIYLNFVVIIIACGISKY